MSAARRVPEMPARPTFQAVNPATGKAGPTYEGPSPGQLEHMLTSAKEAARLWRLTSFEHRAALIRKAAFVLCSREEEFAGLMTQEMGKPFAAGKAEIQKCILNCEHFAAHAADYLTDDPVDVAGKKAFMAFNPLGVVLAIMPWNFPFSQVFRFAAPTLMAGNAVLLKHAANIPGCALAIQDVFVAAGFPEGLFQTLLIRAADVKAVIQHESVAAVSLTGSVEAGRSVAGTAGAALKKCVLELGGSDAYLILQDADIEAAAQVCTTARMLNGGQSCTAAKRFIVVRTVRTAFEKAIVSNMTSFEMLDPTCPSSRLGPMASINARDGVHAQVEASVAGGAEVLLGGEVPARSGAWYPATVLTNVRQGQPAYHEEIFGPVAAIIEAEDEADAIRIANDSCFGLGCVVFTSDVVRGERIAADELDAGTCLVNEAVRSDPRMPFGGIKNSGFGREGGKHGIREFVNVKSVHVPV